MDRRHFLKGLVATAAGVLIPARVAAEPERRIWALDQTMLAPAKGSVITLEWPISDEFVYISVRVADEYGRWKTFPMTCVEDGIYQYQANSGLIQNVQYEYQVSTAMM